MGCGFLPGRSLSRQLYEDAIQPLMDSHAPGLRYGAALIGPGSDVLGYDTARSMDHDWGPRLTIFLADSDVGVWASRLENVLSRELPLTVGGFPTRFREFDDDPGVAHMAVGEDGGSLPHRVRIASLPAFLGEALGISTLDEMDVAAWLTVSEQVLLEVTAGDVFRDDHRELRTMRESLAWYPEDVWRYRLAAAWKRVAQVEPFVGRTGEVGDDLGSHVIGMSLVRDVMRLALLQERRYAPYAKWLGSAFAQLDIASRLMPHLDAARFAREWREREREIAQAMAILARRQNDLALAAWVDPAPRQFHARPFMVIHAERIADALTRSITDPAVRALPEHLGGIDQFVDSTDALMSRDLREVVREWLRRR